MRNGLKRTCGILLSLCLCMQSLPTMAADRAQSGETGTDTAAEEQQVQETTPETASEPENESAESFRTVKFHVEGNGTLKVTAADAVSEVRAENSPFEVSYAEGTVLDIELIADAGYEAAQYQVVMDSGTEEITDKETLAGWKGTVNVSEATEVKAVFTVVEEGTDSEESEYVTNSKGITVKRSLLCDDPDCLEKHVGVTLDPSEVGEPQTITMPSDSAYAELFGNAGDSGISLFSARMVQDPYVGMKLNGGNASVLFLGTPGTAGSFSVTINDGALAGARGTGWCLNHTAANPGEGGAVQCIWSATCTAISGNMATWSIVLTPPGVTDGVTMVNGALAGYQRVGMSATLQFEEAKGSLELRKSSSNPDITDGNSCYSLEGAVYGVYDGNGQEVATMTTDANGYAKVDNLKAGNYTVKEKTAPQGYLLDTNTYSASVPSGSVATLNVQDTPGNDPAAIELVKIDQETGEGTLQGAASLAGAQFTIKYYAGYYDETNLPEATRTWVLETKKVSTSDGQDKYWVQLLDSYKVSGDALYYQDGIPTLPLGTISIEETKAPEGYLLEGGYLQVGGSGDKITGKYVAQITKVGDVVKLVGGNEFSVSDKVVRGGVKIQKRDFETKDAQAQGAATLEGAVFEIVYLDEGTVIVDGQEYSTGDVVKTLTTDADGTAQTDRDTLPYGHYKIREATAPEGYLNSGIIEREFDITENRELVDLTGKSGSIYNQVIRGDVELVKFREDFDGEEEIKTPLEGIEFTFTSKTTGEVLTYTTDEKGWLTTYDDEMGRPGLVYDTYIVEENADTTPKGVKPVEPFEVTVSEEGQTFYYILEDKNITSPVTVVKKDATTGKTIPLADTEFRLLDADKNPVTMTTYYPDEEVHETFKTDEKGQFTFPDKLPYGTYYLEELQAPNGYLKGGLLEFSVEEGHVWAEPLVVEYADQPAMGVIRVMKTDKEDGSPLAGAEFDLTAKEDVVTPDGTVRYTKGQVVGHLVTGEDGTAESGQLYLGEDGTATYILKETKQPDGYILDQTETEVTLTYEGQDTPVVYASVELQNQPTEVILKKVDKETGEPLAGVLFQYYMDGQENTPLLSDSLALTREDGTFELKRLVPGTYHFRELDTVPGYTVDDTVYDITIDSDGRIGGKDVGEIRVTNKHVELVGTTATDQDTGTHEAVPKAETTIIDTVEYKGLQPGKEYEIRGTLMLKSTGEPLMVNGEEVTAETTFVPEEKDGTVDVVFTFDSSALKGESVVAFEKLFDEGVEVAVHEDIEDEGQTVDFPDTQIGTTATDQDTGTHEAIAKEETTIVDAVEYKNVIVGQEYTVKGTLMDKSTGEPLLVNGEEVTAEATFVPEKKNGTVEVAFTFDSSALKGKAVVAFEGLYVSGTEVAVHADLEDEGQTVDFPEHEIGTTATDKESGTHEAVAKKEVTIVDAVECKNLIVGQEYTTKGILMDKSTGEPLLVDGKQVTAEKTFVAEQKNGTVEMTFTFDASSLNGKEVVVFETMYADGVEVAAHQDINDEGQTVKIRAGKLKVNMDLGGKSGGAPKTGDNAMMYRTIGLLLMAAALAGFAILRRKAKKQEGNQMKNGGEDEE